MTLPYSLGPEFNCLDPHVHSPGDQRVFVFGSNLLGIHGAGAALYAREKCGAVLGVGEGQCGNSYALPTCSRPGKPLSLPQLKWYVDRFVEHAMRCFNTRFFVSAVGCGIAGFREEDVAPLFANAPTSCDLPPGWRK